MRERTYRTGRKELIAALDVGSSKVTCLIARVEAGRSGAPQLRVLGIGHQVSDGVKCGAIVDMAAAEGAIRTAVEAAERMAEVTVDDVSLSFSTGAPASKQINIETPVSGQEVGEQDLRRVLQQARIAVMHDDREVLHAVPVAYTIDGCAGIKEPRGMYGDKLGVLMHAVTASTAPLRNLTVCVERCHLRVSSLVVAPFASALAVLVDDEMDLGVTCVDMGAGTTSLAVFRYGAMVHCDVIPIGGQHVTTDIARGLSTSMVHAERMKTLQGSVLSGLADEREMISVPLMGEEESEELNRVPRSSLTRIIRPRLEETFELVRARLQASGCEAMAGRRVVLTGGASQLTGVRELAARILDRQVRLAAPPPLPGLASLTSGPAFATVVGLLNHQARGAVEVSRAQIEGESAGLGQFLRVARWLRGNF